MRRMFSEKQIKEMASAKTKELVEGGTLENAKPIYYHGIVVGGAYVQLQLVILDNNSTPYTSSTALSKLKELMDNGAIINCNGAIEDIDDGVCPVYLIAKQGNNYVIAYHTASTVYKEIEFEPTWNSQNYFNDGVNKIN